MAETKPELLPHDAFIDGDILRFRVVGTLETKGQNAMLALTDKLVAAYGYCLVIIDAKEATSVSPEARRQYAEWAKDHPDRLSYTVIVGANPVVRVLSSFLNRAVSLVTSLSPHPLSFASDDAEAVAAIDAGRIRLRAEVERRRGAKSL